MREHTVSDVLTHALECSIYVSPQEHGLTIEEMIEIASRFDYRQGETRDAIGSVTAPAYFGDTYFRLDKSTASSRCNFFFRESPDYRSIPALDFVIQHLRELGREHGAQHARASRESIVAVGTTRGLKAREVEAAIALMIHGDALTIEDGLVSLSAHRARYPLPSEQINQLDHRQDRPLLARVYPVVKDVIARRVDGRPVRAEPLRAFADALERIGQARFRLWWTQTVDELSRADASLNPITTCVLAAALCEGALTLVVAHAKRVGSPTLASKTFDGSPTQWKFDELLKSASLGSAPILDAKARERAERLNAYRQRIHAGRLLAEIPTGPIPDLRPEEPRFARETCDIVVRAVLDWIERNPATAAH
jgi:hypothetical protein